MDRTRRISLAATVALSILMVDSGGRAAAANKPPVAEAGLSRYAAKYKYAAKDFVRLDGQGSYDPDNSGPLTYAWTQVSGPPLTITGGDTATPTISGFVQTDTIQECEFQLVVTDGELASSPDTVSVVIVPRFDDSLMPLELRSLVFDPNKPTFIYFGGGDCVIGYTGQSLQKPAWAARANILDFPYGYAPDADAGPPTYFHCGDMIIAYLSKAAPNYRQPIQTAGLSTGGQPAIDAALRLNLTYKDARYAVNRVTFLDATPYCRGESYQEDIDRFLANPVDGEQCWIDAYVSTPEDPNHGGILGLKNNVLNVWFDKATDASWTWTDRHRLAYNWYFGSVAGTDANQFNDGVAAGAYWSVIGPGKNLQLASTPGTQTYDFKWYGDASSGKMGFYDESLYRGTLPQPVTLAAWANVSGASGAMDGAVLSCRASENAVGYQLLFGSDPYRVAHYQIISDTPLPPMDIIRDFPSGETWWTVRVRDRYGSTIYVDPIQLNLKGLPPLSIENARTGKRYGLISHAILDARAGDDIVLDPTTYHEGIDFGAKALTVRSWDPNDPGVVAATVVQGQSGTPTVTFSGPESTGCTLAGLTIQSGTVGVSCQNAVPTIRNCVVETPGGIAIEFRIGYAPRLAGCTFLGRVKEADPGVIAYWKLDEASGMIAADSAGTNNGMLIGAPSWQPTGGKIGGALKFDGGMRFVTTGFVCNPSAGPFSAFLWAKGGTPGQVLLSQPGGANWLRAAPDGSLMTELSPPLQSKVVITDGAWHRIGLVWDGKNRSLYVDNAEVAADTQTSLPPSTGGMYIGAASTLTPGTFWSGLIDDVRIYDRAVKP